MFGCVVSRISESAEPSGVAAPRRESGEVKAEPGPVPGSRNKFGAVSFLRKQRGKQELDFF